MDADSSVNVPQPNSGIKRSTARSIQTQECHNLGVNQFAVWYCKFYKRIPPDFFPLAKQDIMFQTEKLICTTAFMFFILRTTAIELNSCMKTLRAYLGVLNVALRRPSPFEILPLVIQEGQVNIVINSINGFRESLFITDSHCLMN